MPLLRRFGDQRPPADEPMLGSACGAAAKAPGL
jgi:hypothetical protein